MNYSNCNNIFKVNTEVGAFRGRVSSDASEDSGAKGVVRAVVVSLARVKYRRGIATFVFIVSQLSIFGADDAIHITVIVEI